MRLYEISEAYNDFLAAYENGDIEESAFADTLESIEGAFEDKAESIACLIKSLDAEVEAIKAEAAKLTDRARVKNNEAERLKAYLAQHMLATNTLKLESPRAKLTFRKSESVEILDELAFIADAQSAGRDDLLTYKAPTVNRTAIKKAIKAGEPVQGAALVEKQNLQIK